MINNIVGIDVGGTFTDIAILSDGIVKIHKLPSTPADPSIAVNQGIKEAGVEKSQFIHGSTVATNALLEANGSKTALITTMGFEDVLEIGRQNRSDLYNLSIERPPALVPWELRFGISERVDHTGQIIEDISKESLDSLVTLIQESNVDSIAISFLFSFINPHNERMVLDALRLIPNPPFISVSSQILPEFREYERTSTVVVNSYVGPVMSRYLRKLETSLGSGLRIMQSSGGSITASLASEEPVRTVLSGPAGGVVGAFHVACETGIRNIITLDMGGTSTDVSLCPGHIQQTSSTNIGGYPIGVPMIEIHTVGAGGGSIAQVDSGGALTVGPQSAGADPGPACYGKGTEITVTDANIVLGRIRADHFLGGAMSLDNSASLTLIKQMGENMAIAPQSVAMGIIRVVNSHMERAIRSISLERGYDPREFTLVPFGGAGPLHTCELAEELGISSVLIPKYPGILSAFGVAISDIVKDYSRTIMVKDIDLNHEQLVEEFSGMENTASDELTGENLDSSNMEFQRFLDIRYIGQSFEITIDCPRLDRPANLMKSISSKFQRAHLQRFGYADKNEPIEIVNLRLRGIIKVEKPSNIPSPYKGTDSSSAIISEDSVHYREGPLSTKLYDRDLLSNGNKVVGPSLIIQIDTTTVIPPKWSGTVDPYGNLLLKLDNNKKTSGSDEY